MKRKGCANLRGAIGKDGGGAEEWKWCFVNEREETEARFVANISCDVIILRLCVARCDSVAGIINAGWGRSESLGRSCRKDRRALASLGHVLKTSESAVCDTPSNAVVGCTCRGALIRRWGETGGGKGRRATESQQYPGICAGRLWNADRVGFRLTFWDWFFLAERPSRYAIFILFNSIYVIFKLSKTAIEPSWV